MTSLEESSKFVDIVKCLIGEEVSSLSNSQYFFNGERDDEDFGDLEVLTLSSLKICFKLLGDGESVGAYKGDLHVPASFDVMKGEQALWKKLVLKQSAKVAGTTVIGIDAMYDRQPKLNAEVLAGWRVKLSNGTHFVFYNCGDNARFLFNELPNDAGVGVETIWQPV